MACIGIIIMLLAGGAAQSEDFPHKRGVELRGSYSLYMNDSDPNAFVQSFAGTAAQSSFTETSGALGGGISFLMKSAPYFSWHVGLNVMGQDSATAEGLGMNGQDVSARVFINTVELFLTANYYWLIAPRFNLQFGAGPAFYMSSLDREVTGTYLGQSGSSMSFFGAHGRSFGFLGDVGAEFFLTPAISLRAGGGYRFAPVSRFKYFREISTTEGRSNEGLIAYWPSADPNNPTYNTFEADFSGPFAMVGLRVYFEPAADWNPYDE
ncbi:MAG: hypothetical protein C4524_13645 [Candidatus Zixiibacteriota bacterium]|nr:MAG: hypothetical protein C4524_13645 [candidate division Zixibacteria bacterium]